MIQTFERAKTFHASDLKATVTYYWTIEQRFPRSGFIKLVQGIVLEEVRDVRGHKGTIFSGNNLCGACRFDDE
jgi:hypothetical protein